jgi:hypothetical protein
MSHVTGRSSLGPGAINVSEGVEPSSASRWRQVISPRRLDRESTGLRLVYSPPCFAASPTPPKSRPRFSVGGRMKSSPSSQRLASRLSGTGSTRSRAPATGRPLGADPPMTLGQMQVQWTGGRLPYIAMQRRRGGVCAWHCVWRVDSGIDSRRAQVPDVASTRACPWRSSNWRLCQAHGRAADCSRAHVTHRPGCTEKRDGEAHRV